MFVRPPPAVYRGHMEPGALATVTLTVGEEDTAIALGSGAVPVLGTPRVVALCEQASVEAINGQLEPGMTTVGVQVMLDHLMPSPVGQEITAEATLEKVKGKKLFFTVAAHDDRGLIAAGKVVRVIVDEAAFLAKCD